MRVTSLVVFGVVLLSSGSAFALSQPNGMNIPTAAGCNGGQPTGLLAAFACTCTTPGICNIGAVCSNSGTCDDGKHGTCESTMWHSFNDNTCIPSNSSDLNPVTEASTTPETFHPTCALTFKVVSRGTALFKDTFGWYNVTGSKPAPTDLHPMIACTDGTGASTVLDIQKEPAYAGGDIGFFLATPQAHGSATCAGGDCCATVARLSGGVGYTFYSERKYNDDAAGANSYIHLLTYNSHIVNRKFFFTWEDMYNGASGDFTDLITSVEGVECSGGGEHCDTGKPGICAQGITTCSSAAISCQPVFAAKPTEECNGVDDDCNGKIDDNATCPNPGDLCQNGTCVHACGSAEFACAPGLSCDAAMHTCVVASCVGVTCAAGQVCRVGKCVEPCSGVVCPHGQSCVGDVCVDLCGGTKCAPGQACRDGVCFAGCTSCDGLVCGAGTKCDETSGGCKDPSCATPCGAGTFCKSGACVDACDGAQCPEGQACSGGKCLRPDQMPDGGLAGLDGTDGGSGTNPEDPYGSSHSNCGCRSTSTGPAGSAASLAVLACAAILIRRRRR